MNSIPRIISRALLASLFVFVAACSNSGDGVLYSGDLPTAPEASTPAPESTPGNIVEVATEAGSFSTLLAAVEAAGLADALSDESASLTVFAPTEEAFAALPDGTLDALLADPDALANVLTYHVLDSAVDVSTALSLAPSTVATLQGSDVAITSRADAYLYVNMSKVVDYDIEASNGVIHVVDSVLLPPDLTPSTMTIAEIAQTDGNFETLVAALTAANLVDTVNDPDASLTVFAPTDAAFEALGDAALNYLLDNPEILESTLLYHVVAGAELSSIDAIVAAGTSLEMANGDEALISLGESGLMIEAANIVTTDIVASNGIIHVIDAVILGDDSGDPAGGGDSGSGDGDGDGGSDTVDIASNGDFEDGLNGWVFTQGAVSVENDGDNYAAATVTAAGNVWSVNLSQIVELEPGVQYTLSFSARATEARTIFAGIGLNYAPWYANVEEVALTTEWTDYTLVLAAIDTGTGENFGDSNNRIIFDLGGAIGDVHIDNVSLTYIGDGSDVGSDPSPNLDGYTLVWQDEFDGLELNANDWNYEFGDGTQFGLPAGWGNDEMQIYTTNAENVSLGVDGDANVLKITALEDGSGGYTSSRITTEDKVSVRYGKIVARIKLPESQGIWPAFWMLGDNIDEASWPGSGEIDVVELVGSAPDETFHTIHYVNSEQSYNFNGNYYNLSSKFSEDYHEFMLDWTPSSITWYVDGNQAHTVTISDDMKEFQRSFHLLLNVAVGGRLPGSPDETSVFPQTMYVDYVRVYQRDGFSPDPAPELDLNEETVGGISEGDGDPSEAMLTGFNAFVPANFARFGAGGEPDWFNATDAVDGNYSVRFAYPGGAWGGAWLALEDATDLTAYSQSNLVFAIKKPGIVAGLEIKIEGLNPSDGSMFLENYTPIDLGNGWEEYSIPLADFVADGLLLDQIVIPFALWNPMAADGSFPEVDILFDAIRFE